MELGLSSLFLIGKPFEFFLRSIKLHDVRLWEIVDENTLRLDEQKVRTLQKLRKGTDLKFTVHAPFADVNIASLVPEVRQMAMSRLRESLLHASTLEAVAWVMHPGLRGALTTFYPEEEWKLNVEAIVSMATLAKELDVQICLENMPKGFSALMNDPESFNRIYEEFGRELFKIVLDIGHANTSGTVTTFLDMFREQVVHIHAHDNQGKLDLHEEIGKGTVNWPVVAKKIRRSLCRTIVVESTKGVEASLERLRQLLNCSTDRLS